MFDTEFLLRQLDLLSFSLALIFIDIVYDLIVRQGSFVQRLKKIFGVWKVLIFFGILLACLTYNYHFSDWRGR